MCRIPRLSVEGKYRVWGGGGDFYRKIFGNGVHLGTGDTFGIRV
jgi:hypothetical protein